MKIKKMTFIWDKWPQITFCDLVTIFFWKLTSRASFWYLNILFTGFHKCSKFDLFWNCTSDDLWWPRDGFFFENWRQERHFDIQYTHFPWTSKFDPQWPQMWNSTPNLFNLKLCFGLTCHFELQNVEIGRISYFWKIKQM